MDGSAPHSRIFLIFAAIFASAMALAAPSEEWNGDLQLRVLTNPRSLESLVDKKLRADMERFERKIVGFEERPGWLGRAIKHNDSGRSVDRAFATRIVGAQAEAYGFKKRVDAIVAEFGTSSGQSYGALLLYTRHVFFPTKRLMDVLDEEERLRPRDVILALLPAWDGLGLEDGVRVPAAAMPAGEGAAVDASDADTYYEDVVATLNERLRPLAEELKAALDFVKAYNELKAEADKPLPQRPTQPGGRGYRAVQITPEQAAKREADFQRRLQAAKDMKEKAKSMKGSLETNKEKIKMLYVEAVRLTTIQLMLSQVETYKQQLNDPTPLDLRRHAPKCIARYKNALPDKLHFQPITEENRELGLLTFLASNGLIHRPIAATENPETGEATPVFLPEFEDTYLFVRNRDPIRGGISGQLPFRHARIAQQGVQFSKGDDPLRDLVDDPFGTKNAKEDFKFLGEPAFDDLTDFRDIWAIKLTEAMDGLNEQEREFALEVLDVAKPEPRFSVDENGEIVEREEDPLESFYLGRSKFLVRRLKEGNHNPAEWWRALPGTMNVALRLNELKIDFPPFYGPDSYKQWAMRLLYHGLAKAAQGDQIDKSNILRLRSQICYRLYGQTIIEDNPMCGRLAGYNEVSKVTDAMREILRPFTDPGMLVPPSQVYDSDLRRIWGDLRSLWIVLRDRGHLNGIEEEASPVLNEWEFIDNQIEYNSWASLRVAALLAIEDVKAGKVPGLRGYARPAQGRAEMQGRGRDNGSYLKQAFEKMGLLKPIGPFMGNRLLDEDQKTLAWSQIVALHDEANGYSFRRGHHDARDYYGIYEVVAGRTLLTSSQIENTVFRPYLPNEDLTETRAEIAEADQADDSRRFKMLMNVWQKRGRVEEQEAIVSRYLEDNPWDETLADASQVKDVFMKRDESFRIPVYKQILKTASRNRMAALIAELDEFCGLDAEDGDDYRKLISATTSVQKQFNQMLGLEAIPEEVLAVYDEWTSRDWFQMGMAGLIMAGFVGLEVSKVLCASPLAPAACPAMAGLLAVTLMAAPTAALIVESGHEMMTQEQRMRFSKAFQELGFTDEESVEKVRGGGWGGFAFEIVTSVTLIKPAVTAMKVAGRPALQYFAKRALQRAGVGRAIAADGAHVWEAVDTHAAKVLFRFADDIPFGKILTGSIDAFRSGARSALLDPVRVTQSAAEINKAWGKIVADFFKNDGAQLGKFMNKNVAKRVAKVQKLIEAAQNVPDPRYSGALQRIIHGWRFSPSRMAEITARFAGNPAFFGEAVERVTKLTGDELAEYLAKNADQLAPFFVDYGMSLARLPGGAMYMMFFQGSPWMYNRIPGVRGSAMRAFMKQAAFAREKLLYHSFRTPALQALGYDGSVMAVDLLGTLRASRAVASARIAKLAAEGATEESDKVFRQWKLFEDDLATRLARAYYVDGVDAPLLQRMTGSGLRPNIDAGDILRMKQLLFQASDEVENKMIRSLVLKLGPEKLLDVPTIRGASNEVLLKMSKEYRNLDEFGDFVSLLSFRIRLVNAATKPNQVINY
jgi:hypothetical protein